MARHVIGISLLGLLLTGCVAQEKYNALKIEKDQLVEQLQKAEADAAAARSERDAYKNQIDQLLKGNTGAAEMIAKLNEELAAAKGMNADLMRKYEDALKNRVGDIVVNMPEGLRTALEQFAKENADLVEFDPTTGIVKFKSDVTFAKGSADLAPQAKVAIGKFAQILNSPAAKDYEFFVAGHTDSTPVNNPNTVRAGHKDNWYLSVHRAISVGNELMHSGITPRRLGVVGYADQRPVASNATAEGQTRNRRVEVALLPTTYRGPAAETAPRATPAVRKPELNKDAVVPPAPSQPTLNK